MSGSIHPTAVVDSRADLADGVELGAYATVGPGVRLGEGVVLRAHAHVTGNTEVGAESVVFPFASIGERPQDQKYRGEDTRLILGERNQLREYVTVNPGTASGGGVTAIGDDNLLMAGAHVAHDCRIGNRVILSNQVMLAGHVQIEDYAVIEASTGIQQFLRIGESAFVGAISGVIQDVSPFCFVHGYPARVLKINRIGLERRGWGAERIADVERAFRLVFRSKLSPDEAFARIRTELPDSKDAQRMLTFLEASERGFARAR
ncbi:MAG: acyl-ACP--UDP-N-acetylglucosamine O-acyltransferase [Proteobacteria bacterium]|nr:acyl-ACP--UDP-N-acetylglucosamine O-acyltransferase [Pseudomonadota bacterium]